MNLLNETIDILLQNGKTPADVEFVTDGKVYCSMSEFMKCIDFKYNEGYGGHEIHLPLKVVGKDFWLERQEYDGSEWWEFQTRPIKPDRAGKPQIRVGLWA